MWWWIYISTFQSLHAVWRMFLTWTSRLMVIAPTSVLWLSGRASGWLVTRRSYVWLLLGELGFFLPSCLCHWLNRDFKIQRRDRNEKVKKYIRFNKQNNLARASHFFVHFFCHFCTTTTWKCLISRFMENVNKQRRNFISLSQLGYGPLEFNFTTVRLHLTK